MNIPYESAEALSAQLDEASALCSESLRVVRANENLGVLEVYARLVGLFLGNSYTNVLAPLWERYPELEPESMKQPYVEPTPSLSPASQEAIAAFLHVAVPALAQAQSLLGAGAGEKPLPFGGVAEVARTVVEIEEFLRKPRFRDDEPENPNDA